MRRRLHDVVIAIHFSSIVVRSMEEHKSDNQLIVHARSYYLLSKSVVVFASNKLEDESPPSIARHICMFLNRHETWMSLCGWNSSSQALAMIRDAFFCNNGL